ncbi:MAG: HD domain-containing protein [Saprospiraceae bacterium]
MDIQRIYLEALKFASAKHFDKNQLVPGTNLPYVVHLSCVAMEILVTALHTPNFDLNIALPIALLHDTIEDTKTDFNELQNKFGLEVAIGVSALTKNIELPKGQQMFDSLTRIKKLSEEIWAVKLADRITNLQPPPPHWNKQKKLNYQNEAKLILNELKTGNSYLANRLEIKIEEYGSYINRDL